MSGTYSDFPPVDRRHSVRPYAIANPSLAPTNQSAPRATRQNIRSYTNAHNHHLQEKIPPTRPYIGLRPAYRPHYALCVILAGIINVISGILMTAISWSAPYNNTEPYRVLRVLGPIVLVIGLIFLLCGVILLGHYRKGKRKRRKAIERGHPYVPSGTSHRRDRREDIPKTTHETQQGSTVLRGPTSGMSDYSYYDELQRTNERRSGRQDEHLPRGDWKYVSKVRDATFAPKPPREERKSNVYDTRPAHTQHFRMSSHGRGNALTDATGTQEKRHEIHRDFDRRF